MGLLAHPALSKESPKGVSGNYLFLDLIASLQWIQKNIAAFGGDPDNVTIFGESGGGAKVSVMMSSPLAKGLFHRAICESGTALAILGSKPLADIEKDGEILFQTLGIDSKADPLEQVRTLPFSTILEANQVLEPPRTPNKPPAFIWDGAVDGWVLPDSPENIFKSGKCNAVPLIVAANLGELTGPGPLVMPFIIPAYVEMLKPVTKQGKNGYACIFDQVPAGWRSHGFVSIHSIELTYVFGDWDNSTGWWKSIAALAQQAGVKSSGAFLDETDKYVSETMMELWANFAKNGKPSADGISKWPEYTESTDQYMYVCGNLEIKTGFSKAAQ
jgi:para-nitrobenzyl esterase